MSLTTNHNANSASGPNATLASVKSELTHAMDAHDQAINELGIEAGVLEGRLLFFLHSVPPADMKACASDPVSSNPVVAYISTSTKDITRVTNLMRSISERLPT